MQFRPIEPFFGIGNEAIQSKNHAINIIKENSYYFIIWGLISSLLNIYGWYYFPDKSIKIAFISKIIESLFYIILAFLFSYSRSRIAAILALIITGHACLSDIYFNRSSYLFVYMFLFISALRVLRVSIYYHKNF